MTIIERIAEAVISKILSEWAAGKKVKAGDILDIELCLCPESKHSTLRWPVLAIHLQIARERKNAALTRYLEPAA